jgi:hypothetical protein
MARKRRKQPKICAYCGGEPTTDWTDDEPVPKCLFARPRDNLVSVPACSKCNSNEKSLDDSYLRDMLAIDAALALHPDGPFIRAAFERSVKKDASVVARIVRENYGKMAFDPKTGLLLPTPVSLNGDRVRARL